MRLVEVLNKNKSYITLEDVIEVWNKCCPPLSDFESNITEMYIPLLHRSGFNLPKVWLEVETKIEVGRYIAILTKEINSDWELRIYDGNPITKMPIEVNRYFVKDGEKVDVVKKVYKHLEGWIK